jgi:cellulose synthase/poly-beta-1,6-N-acetylglucosamine synthase-like glycosyltransferase
MITLQVIFWTSIFLIFHTYVLFPAILRILAAGRQEHRPASGTPDLPFLSILVAAYNEERVIEAKLMSVLESDYPADKYEILVGSDASTDRTGDILLHLQREYPQLIFSTFSERRGKPGVVNLLAERARGELLVITDANVMLDRDTLKELALSLADPGNGLVDTRMVNTQLRMDGISHQERFYINREVKIKHHESLVWGTMMGPFGGCYAVRKSCFRPVPDQFLVDDFFINMTVLKQGYRCISNIHAKVYEDVSNDLKEEFRRKKRISAGNFQNLARFRTLLISGRPGIAFCFLSHKVIRWMVPFLVMITLGTSISLGTRYPFYLVIALLHAVFLLLPLIDFFLRKLRIQSIPLRFISHFVLMNFALLAGFIKYLGGIKSNVWQPTRRNQGETEQR